MRARDLLRPSRDAVAILAACVAIGLLSFGYRGLDDLARDHHGNGVGRFVEEMSSMAASAVLIPFLLAFVRRYRVTKATLWPRLGAYFFAAVAWSALLTSARWGIRSLVYPLVGLGAYDYGIMPIRYAMELPNDLLWFAIIATFVHLLDEYRDARDREVRTAQLEARLAQAQLQALRLQLQPHFLFNTLNTISSVLYEDPRAADEMLSRLSTLLRATLATSTSQEVTLDEELRVLDLYVDIMRARFEDRLAVSLDVDEAARDAFVPQLLLQPLVENAIKHGSNASAVAEIVVTARRTADGALELRVRDRGPGLADGAAEPVGLGVGLANTAERLERLYGAEHGFRLQNADGGGLAVDITIPFRTAAI